MACVLLALAGCSTPIQVKVINPRDVQREMTTNMVSTGTLSEPTRIVLHRHDLSELFERDPEATIASLHRTATTPGADPLLLFALAELSFRHAEDTGKKPYYLATAVYAFAYLFPTDPARRPSAFDPDVRIAGDLYNRGLTSAFATADRSRVNLRSGAFALPFGLVDVTFNADSARWGHLALTEFTPADELQVIGLSNRYRQRGLGAPLAANSATAADDVGFDVTRDVKIPVTALLRLDASRQTLAEGRLRGTLDLYPAFEPGHVEIRGQSVPLEIDTSAALASGLSNKRIWKGELGGFLKENYFDSDQSPIEGLEPYRPGQIPVLFIHGTKSSTARWADLINDLQSDPIIREHFQFWWYSYSSSNPIPVSALRLRQAIADAVRKVDPDGKDPALKQGVLIGHSQGGLLAKMLVINSGSRIWDAMSSKPLEDLDLPDETRRLLRQELFVTPVPQVRRVIFIATPHHGSFLAASPLGKLVANLVSMPSSIASGLGSLTPGKADAFRFDPDSTDFGSVWWMTPGNPATTALAEIPVAPTITAYSIIPVSGNGPIDTADDGVVTYKSAHIDGVESELIIRNADHSVQSNPHTVDEVRRILLLHLATACPQGCARPPGADNLAAATPNAEPAARVVNWRRKR